MDYLFILKLQDKSLVMDAIRSFFSYIDSFIYLSISLLFRTIFNLANFDYVKLYEMMEDRIYVILGIFMLFKVTVSLLTYLVNPDRITDKEQGATKLVTRIILVLVMLIGLPTFFSLMTEFQNKVLPVIPRIIMGTTTELTSDNVGAVSDDMATNILKGFFKPGRYTEGNSEKSCGENELYDFSDLPSLATERCDGNRGYYKYEYRSLMSIVVGIMVCYMVFSLCISVAIRAFKLILLRMIAPIPVISYLDPKSSKDGAFHHWSKTFMSTWGELFIHLGIIYLIVYMISFIISSTFWLNIELPENDSDGTLMIIFLIIGLLYFAKSAPQFIFDALGIKSKGGFTKMLGMGSTALSGLGSGVAATRAALEKSKNKNGHINPFAAAYSFGKGITSMGGAMAAGGNALLTSDKATLTTGMDAAKKFQAKDLNEIRSGYHIGKKLLSGTKSLFGYDINNAIQHERDVESAAKKYKEYAIGEGTKKFSNKAFDVNGVEAIDSSGATISADLNLTKNEILTLVSQARMSGSDVIYHHATLGDINLGAADGASVTKILGDLDEAMGTEYVHYVEDGHENADKTRVLNGFATTYANATGYSKAKVKSQSITDVKNVEKAAGGNAFNLEAERGPKK